MEFANAIQDGSVKHVILKPVKKIVYKEDFAMKGIVYVKMVGKETFVSSKLVKKIVMEMESAMKWENVSVQTNGQVKLVKIG